MKKIISALCALFITVPFALATPTEKSGNDKNKKDVALADCDKCKKKDGDADKDKKDGTLADCDKCKKKDGDADKDKKDGTLADCDKCKKKDGDDKDKKEGELLA